MNESSAQCTCNTCGKTGLVPTEFFRTKRTRCKVCINVEQKRRYAIRPPRRSPEARARWRAAKQCKEGVQATCRECGRTGSAPGEFYWSCKYVCKSCRKHRAKHASLSRTDEQIKRDQDKDRFKAITRKYALTREEFSAKAESQGWKCAICDRDIRLAGRQLQVDHCHSTGKVRDLLCGPCNRGLSQMRDDPARLRKAADYLERHAAAITL